VGERQKKLIEGEGGELSPFKQNHPGRQYSFQEERIGMWRLMGEKKGKQVHLRGKEGRDMKRQNTEQQKDLVYNKMTRIGTVGREEGILVRAVPKGEMVEESTGKRQRKLGGFVQEVKWVNSRRQNGEKEEE